jgi:hypothetical protein
MFVGTALGLIAVERLLNASLLPFAANGPSVRLGTAFICGGLAPIVFVIGYLKARQERTQATRSAAGQ